MVKWVIVNLRSNYKVNVKAINMVMLKIAVDYYLRYKKPLPTRLLRNSFRNAVAIFRYFESLHLVKITKDGRKVFVTPTDRAIEKLKDKTYKEVVMEAVKRKKAILPPEAFNKYLTEKPLPLHVII